MNRKITFITGNMGKVAELQRYLGIEVDHQKLDLPEIQSLDPEEIARDKAERAYAIVGSPVLVEDVSLTFTALGKLPGTFIKYFEQELGNEGLCRLVDGKDRSCTATVTYGYHDGHNVMVFQGMMFGSVATSPRGERSFGWASIFIPTGYQETYAELPDTQQDIVSMRRLALTQFREVLAHRHLWKAADA